MGSQHKRRNSKHYFRWFGCLHSNNARADLLIQQTIDMTPLKPGEQAPAFVAKDQNGDPISLSDFSGQKLILFFYPHDLTPTCTTEACNLRDHYSELLERGFAVVGVSEDDAAKHQKFIAKHELPYPLIADTDHQLLNAYGVWGEKKFMGKVYDGTHRTTFVIDENGVLEQVITKVKSKEHAAQILGGVNWLDHFPVNTNRNCTRSRKS